MDFSKLIKTQSHIKKDLGKSGMVKKEER